MAGESCDGAPGQDVPEEGSKDVGKGAKLEQRKG